MMRSVNQWLDWVDKLTTIEKEKKETQVFLTQLTELKFAAKYKGYGGKVMVDLPRSLKYLFERKL